jgi:hypothetical protein
MSSLATAWFDSLGGKWRLVKRVSNGCRFAGAAEFAKLPGGDLRLTESGRLILPTGAALAASQTWIWRMDEANELIVEYPPERGGGPYHRSTLSFVGRLLRGSADHLCGNDHYRTIYRISIRAGSSEFHLHHRVTGPAKAHCIAQHFSRL